MTIRFEKLDLRNLDAPHVLDGIAGRSYLPPSFLPEENAPLPALPAAAPPPPVFNEQQVKQAEQESYRKGFLEGTKEGQMQAQSEQTDIDRQLSEATAHFAERIHAVLQQQATFLHEQKSHLAQLALAVASKIAGEALSANPLPLIEGMVIPCVERVLGAPHIAVSVNDKLAPTLEKRLTAHFAHHTAPGEISIHGDASLPIGDCRIDWGNGYAERCAETLWTEIEKILGTRRAAAPAPAPAAAAAAPEISAPAQDAQEEESEPPLSEAALSLREAIGDEPLIDPKLINELPTEGE